MAAIVDWAATRPPKRRNSKFKAFPHDEVAIEGFERQALAEIVDRRGHGGSSLDSSDPGAHGAAPWQIPLIDGRLSPIQSL